MDIISAAAAGTALAADACAVSVVCGASPRRGGSMAAATAVSFGLFQAAMPVLGWSIGKVGSSMLHGFDHLAAFLILCFLGVKMMFDAAHPPEDDGGAATLRGLLLLSLATSVDALTAGVALPAAVGAGTVLEVLLACGMIGGITAVLSLVGYLAGSRAGKRFPTAARLLGGAALIALGIKALLQ